MLLSFFTSCSSSYGAERTPDTLARITELANGKTVYVFSPADNLIDDNGLFTGFVWKGYDQVDFEVAKYDGMYCYVISKTTKYGILSYDICFVNGDRYTFGSVGVYLESGDKFLTNKTIDDWNCFFTIQEFDELSAIAHQLVGQIAFPGTDITIKSCDLHKTYFSCGGSMNTKDYHYGNSPLFALANSDFEKDIKNLIISSVVSNPSLRLSYDDFDEIFTLYSTVLNINSFNFELKFTEASVDELHVKISVGFSNAESLTMKCDSATINIYPDYVLSTQSGGSMMYFNSSITELTDYLASCLNKEIKIRIRNSYDSFDARIVDNRAKEIEIALNIKAALSNNLTSCIYDTSELAKIYSPYDEVIVEQSDVSYVLPAGYCAHVLSSNPTLIIQTPANTTIAHVTADMYEQQTEAEKKIYPRASLTNDFFDKEFYSTSFGIPTNEISMIKIGDTVFYSFVLDSKSVICCMIHNGFSEMFIGENENLTLEGILREMRTMLVSFKTL